MQAHLREVKFGFHAYDTEYSKPAPFLHQTYSSKHDVVKHFILRHMIQASIQTLLMLNSCLHSHGLFVFWWQVGPYYNPSETYPYYTLPVCKPEKIETVTSLGGKLDGDKLAKSLYNLNFGGMLLCRCTTEFVFCFWGVNWIYRSTSLISRFRTRIAC